MGADGSGSGFDTTLREPSAEAHKGDVWVVHSRLELGLILKAQCLKGLANNASCIGNAKKLGQVNIHNSLSRSYPQDIPPV